MGNFDDTIDWTGASDEPKSDDEEGEKKRKKPTHYRNRKTGRMKLTKDERKRRSKISNKRSIEKQRRNRLAKGYSAVKEPDIDEMVDADDNPWRKRSRHFLREGSGSRMDVWEISQWIADEVNDCEWAHDVHFRNDDYEDPWFDFSTDEGDVFKVTVRKVK